MMRITGSSNFGHGVCCRPDYNEGVCGATDSNHVCSPPSREQEGDDTYDDVISSNGINYQMYAFCPFINRRKCGIEDSSSTDMNLVAGTKHKVVSNDEMRYIEGRPEVR
jgi:hypothetical protein